MIDETSAILCLRIVALPVQLLTQLLYEFTLGPGETMIRWTHHQNVLLVPSVAFDFLGITATTSEATREESHRTPPRVSMDQRRIAIASASLSSLGLKPRAWTAAITVSLSALPLPQMKRFQVPTGTP